MTAALEGDEWSYPRPGRVLLSEKTPHPFYRRIGGPQRRSGRAENLVPTGIRSRTVPPVAQSLYRLSYRAHTVSIIGVFFKHLYKFLYWLISSNFLFYCHILGLKILLYTLVSKIFSCFPSVFVSVQETRVSTP